MDMELSHPGCEPAPSRLAARQPGGRLSPQPFRLLYPPAPDPLRAGTAQARPAAWPRSWPVGQTSDSGITHSIVISGNPLTMEIAEDDSIAWQYQGEGAGDSRPGGKLIDRGRGR